MAHLSKRKYLKKVESVTQSNIKAELEFINKTIYFHENLIKEMKQKIWDIRRMCEHKYKPGETDPNARCLKCDMCKLESYQYTPLNREEYILQAKKLKAIYIKDNNKENLLELRSLLEDKNLEDSSYPTIDQL